MRLNWRLIAGLLLALWLGDSTARSDALALQQQAIKRIDAFILHFRKTGDYQTRVRELLLPAQQDLSVSAQGFEAQNDIPKLVVSLYKLGETLRLQGQWDSAVQVYQQTIQAAHLAKDDAHQARALARMALAKRNKRDLQGALDDVTQAIALAQRAGDHKALFDALDIRGLVQVDQGDLAAASESLQRAFEAAKASSEPDSLFFAYFDRADVYYKLADQCDFARDTKICQRQYDLAAADYQQAREIAQRQGWTGLAREVDGLLSNLDLRRGIARSQEQVQAMLKDHFNPRQASDVLVNEQFVARDATDAESLAAMYRQLVQDNERAGPFADISAYRMHVTDAQLRQLRGDKAGASQAFDKAIELVERDRRGLAEERARAAYLQDKVVVYHGAIAELLDQKRHAEAFSLMERVKSRAMSDLLAKRELVLGDAQDRTLYGKSLELRSRIARLQNEHFAMVTGQDAKQQQLAQHLKQIQQLEDEHQQLVARMEQQSPKLKDLVESRPAELAALQQTARAEGFEVLQYLVRDNDILLWYIGPQRVEVRVVFVPRNALVEKVAKLQASLADREAAFDEHIARQLYLYLVEPARAWLRGKRVVVIPHDVLHVLPFQALIAPDGGAWGDLAQITYAPSATVLLSLKQAAPIRNAKLLAIADPGIAAARAEVQAISALYANGSKVAFDRLAKESEVKAWVKDHDLLHLSVHGKFDAAEPLFSHLKLSGGGQEDGKLTAAEIFALPIEKARLVVLSACETGKAEVTRGDEVMGFTRAFLYAGAQSLILSHWRVDADSTRLWMETFYRAAQTQVPAEAARRALLAVKSKKEYSHPYYWAAFTVIGR
jgi:CHAT domain-containing protein/tetratricopeptide (TPR) repeat protein